MRYTDDDGLDEPTPPNYNLESIPMPPSYKEGGPPMGEDATDDPAYYRRKRIKSAHMVEGLKLSARDSATVTEAGTIVHGRYGDLGVLDGIPVEYAALLHPAAEGAAAFRSLGATEPGTIVVYGASQPAGLAATQLASAAGNAVVAVVGSEHNGFDTLMDSINGFTKEPGCCVPEELATLKKNFYELLESTMKGDKCDAIDTETYLSDFVTNTLDYAEAFPNTRPAAVGEHYLEFWGMDKDREHFRENMDAYLDQFTKGSPPINGDALKAKLNIDIYKAMKAKFNPQMTKVITGDPHGEFNAADFVSDISEGKWEDPAPEHTSMYEFVVDRKEVAELPKSGGPMKGCIVNPTPELMNAIAKLGSLKLPQKTLREKAEALTFLSDGERNAITAVTTIVQVAKDHNVPLVVTGGSLPGYKSTEVTDEDVQEALSAMDIDEDGSSRLNYFVQVYRAGDFPIYEQYAIHRQNAERLAGPRQFVVTKS
eukprot:CAMPEP_0194028436 /NCGR_PEP_ID=MMETSP0009_2-20130614/2397_1 /TAXON_ID=210454 /ORGANISM="Grammatophora oceanica, Strain CCMP 410" /LENGTH=482 /DNA_ID=CAMNT_0038667825 /DNA_START=136 /DNA_END=1584 /DNA_ORIENTATION=-